MEEENAATPFDVIVAAGIRVLSALSAGPDLVGKLWGLPALPDPLEFLAGGPSPMLDAITAARDGCYAQMRSPGGCWTVQSPGAAQKTVVFTDDDADDAMTRTGPIAELLERSFPTEPRLAARRRPLRVVVAGHALHFLAGVMERLRVLSEVEFRVGPRGLFCPP